MKKYERVSEVCFIYSPCADIAEAEKLGERLLAEKLAACINIIPIKSLYNWEGKMERGDEAVLLAKTTKARSKKAMERIVALHSYQLPSVTAFCESAAHPRWRNWVAEQVKPQGG